MSKIDGQWWTKSWNPISGCTPVSEACEHCWAAAYAKRFWGNRKFGDIRFHPKKLDQPLHWKKPQRIFVCSISDILHPDITVYARRTDGNSEPFEQKAISRTEQIFRMMSVAKWHTYYVLTKRINLLADEISKSGYGYSIKQSLESNPNIWLGVTCENQKRADERIPILLQIPCAKRFVCFEPLLGEIDNSISYYLEDEDKWGGIKWVIIGCESLNGKAGRFCENEHKWYDAALDIIEQCNIVNVPVWVKQIPVNGRVCKDMNRWPKELRIREYD